MMDIERISEKIVEEMDNQISKAFTDQIAGLLITNGIVPIMTEYRKVDLENIDDKDKYLLVEKFGISFDRLDTSEHDKQIREKFIDDQASLLAFICKKYNIPLLDMNCTVDEWEELKEQNNG